MKPMTKLVPLGVLLAMAGVETHGAWGLLRSVAVEPRARGTGLRTVTPWSMPGSERSST